MLITGVNVISGVRFQLRRQAIVRNTEMKRMWNYLLLRLIHKLVYVTTHFWYSLWAACVYWGERALCNVSGEYGRVKLEHISMTFGVNLQLTPCSKASFLVSGQDRYLVRGSKTVTVS